MKIGIVGLGYVGKAIAASHDADLVFVHDPAYPKQSVPIQKLVDHCNVIFVCVPTPQRTTGDCDISILEEVLSQLAGFEGVVISKCTAPPEVYIRLERDSGLNLAHVPEFLTQANYVDDYINPKKVVIGARPDLHVIVGTAIMCGKVSFPLEKIDYCSIGEAAFFKYLANTQLAMKVVANNEYYSLARSMGLNWTRISSIAATDERLGTTHWRVPGPDGSRGYAGACFPKDVAALAALAQDHDVEMSMLNQAIIRNIELRGEN